LAVTAKPQSARNTKNEVKREPTATKGSSTCQVGVAYPFMFFEVLSVWIYKSKSWMILIWLVGLLLTTFGCDDAGSRKTIPDQPLAESTIETGISVENVTLEQPQGESTKDDEFAERWREEYSAAKSVCYDLLKDDFTSAEQKLNELTPIKGGWLSRLNDIVERYKLIDEQRLVSRQEAYEEQLTKLAELRDAPPDTNEANDISSVLVVVAKASNLAEPNEKKEFLNDPFVKQYIEKAIKHAAKYEVQGEWSEAYTECYALLTQIDEKNKDYSDYADELLEKILIKSSLQDSPCETRQQRYNGINRSMFIRALRVIDLSHVAMLDYKEMALKALQRCELLGEILLFDDTFAESDLSKPDPKAVSAWSAALQVVADEIGAFTTGISKDKFIAVFGKVLSFNIVTIKLPEEVIISHFADASLAAVDPHTNLIWPYYVRDFQKDMTHKFSGIGIEIRKEAGQLKTASLLPDTPAYRSGLDAGDIIEAVDGLSTEQMSLRCAVKKITGPKGTKVTLKVKHPNQEQSEEITIVRDNIIVPTIRGWQRTAAGKWRYFIDQDRKIGYVRVMSFVEKTADELENALRQLEEAGLKALILDLRFNTGGHLSSAVEISDKFVDEGIIVSTRPRYGVPIWETAHKKGTHPNYPLVILINEQSASASEIVAGALQDPVYRRATLVGTRTHGKGSVQTIIDYPGGGSQLKYTTAYYHLPSGQRVVNREDVEEGSEDWGISPDVKIKIRPDELQEMFKVQRDNDILVKADHDTKADPLNKSTLEQTLKADPQLAIAALIIRVKLVESEINKMVEAENTMEKTSYIFSGADRRS
jgi:carboxyl-terminal processing protease